MATEYKLSYTASEIDKKLGQIDNLAAKDEIPTKTSQLTNDSGFITGYSETDPTVPSWAKQASKPSYTASEVGALPSTTKIPSKTSDLTNDSGYITGYTETDPTVPAWAKNATKPSYSKSEVGLGNVDNVKQYSASNPPPYPVTSVNNKTGAVTLNASDVGARPSSWTPSYSDVGAEKSGTAAAAVSSHNTNTSAHNDIRLLVDGLSSRINALANSTDEDLDQMAEIVAYIKNNKTLIDNVTTSKVNVADIINNLTTNVSNKPLSAAQGVALKALIDALENDKLEASALSTAISTALAQAKSSGEFDGEDGVSATHKWNGTVLTVTSASGTSSADLKGNKGDSGVYMGSVEPTDPNVVVWVNPDGEADDLDYVLTDEDKNEIADIVKEEVPFVKTAEHPKAVTSVSEMTDTSKIYWNTSDGMLWAYKARTVEVPDFTNLVDNPNSYFKKGYRYSNSSGAFVEKKGENGFVVPVPTGNITLRVKPYRTGFYNYIYGSSSSNQTFPTVLRSESAFTVDGDVGTAELSNSSCVYITFANCYDAEEYIVTVNEPITYHTETVHEWVNTGRAYNQPADYEDRVIELEETAIEHTEMIAALKKAVESGATDVSPEAAYDRIKNWQYPIYEDAPVFLLETNKPALTVSDMTTSGIYAKYDALMAANSHYITKVNCGMASDGATPIYCYHFRQPNPHYLHNGSTQWTEKKPTFLVCSGVHPLEQTGIHSMFHALEEITTNPELFDLKRNLHIIVFPMLNPTAFEDDKYHMRNPDGVQVHHNFEVGHGENGATQGDRYYGGATPLSIPETQYFDAVMEEYKDSLVCVLSCHNNELDERHGTGVIWCSCATHFTCNLGFRFADKMSIAWREKYGAEVFDAGIRWANDFVLAQYKNPTISDFNWMFDIITPERQEDWDYLVGRSNMSGSGGTEYRQGTKYGIHGVNVETCPRCMILDRNYNAKNTSNVITMGTETYINYFRTFMAAYDPKDKKDYAPNLPWSE